MTAAQRIGRNIRRRRRAIELTQEACAERAGIHRVSITGYEWGEREPKSVTLVKLAGALGVEPAVLLEGVRWEPGRFGPGRFVIEEEA
jgi:transcriptional regulator with XRE-family HTH domain